MPAKPLKFIKRLLRIRENSTTEDPVDDNISPQVIKEYHELLHPSLPYYTSLTDEERERFLKRLYTFHQSKQFHFIGMADSKEPTLMISAVAIQITFGLRKFMLSFFRDIYIMPDAYHLHGAGEYYIGHVSPKGIYISWKHFKEGFAIPNDGINVAYHELAHAIHHENFAHQKGIDWDFREDFAKMSHVFGPSLSEAMRHKKSYLRGYAFRDFYEFWAVSVEAFFEDPQGLMKSMPQLYKILADTLNQDPMLTPKVLAAS